MVRPASLGIPSPNGSDLSYDNETKDRAQSYNKQAHTKTRGEAKVTKTLRSLKTNNATQAIRQLNKNARRRRRLDGGATVLLPKRILCCQPAM